MSLYKELGQAFKLKLQEGESYDDFAIRASSRVNKCTNEEWKELSADLQTWNNEVMEAREANAAKAKGEELEAFPELEGFPEEAAEETVVDEDGVVQEEDTGSEDAEEENTAEESSDGVDESAEEEQDATAEDPPQRKKPKQEKKMPARAVTAEKEKPPKAVAKKATEKPAAKKATNGSAGKRSRLDPEATIKILAKENPHREGSSRYKRWGKYKDGMTVKEALKAGFNAGDLNHSVNDGNIKIV